MSCKCYSLWLVVVTLSHWRPTLLHILVFVCACVTDYVKLIIVFGVIIIWNLTVVMFCWSRDAAWQHINKMTDLHSNKCLVKQQGKFCCFPIPVMPCWLCWENPWPRYKIFDVGRGFPMELPPPPGYPCWIIKLSLECRNSHNGGANFN